MGQGTFGAEATSSILSGKTHQVYTGITLKSLTKTITKTDLAHVELENINAEEIDFYIKNYRPFDKAGSYGIQTWRPLFCKRFQNERRWYG